MSTNFPVVNPWQATCGGPCDAFVCRLALHPLHMSRISATGGAVRIEWVGEGSQRTQFLMQARSPGDPPPWSCIHTCAPLAVRRFDVTGRSNGFYRVEMPAP